MTLDTTLDREQEREQEEEDNIIRWLETGWDPNMPAPRIDLSSISSSSTPGSNPATPITAFNTSPIINTSTHTSATRSQYPSQASSHSQLQPPPSKNTETKSAKHLNHLLDTLNALKAYDAHADEVVAYYRRARERWIGSGGSSILTNAGTGTGTGTGSIVGGGGATGADSGTGSSGAAGVAVAGSAASIATAQTAGTSRSHSCPGSGSGSGSGSVAGGMSQGSMSSNVYDASRDPRLRR